MYCEEVCAVIMCVYWEKGERRWATGAVSSPVLIRAVLTAALSFLGKTVFSFCDLFWQVSPAVQ